MNASGLNRARLPIGVFAAIGAGVGVAMHQLALGVGIGVALGAIFAIFRSRNVSKDG